LINSKSLSSKGLSVTLALTLCAVSLSSAEEKQKMNFSDSPWNGRYLHKSGKFELILNQFSRDSLDVDIFPIPRSDHEHESHFFALIRRNLATHSDKREHNCWVDLKKVPTGVIVLDHCNGAEDDAGLYNRIKDKAGA
jgi:hypothetical protein